MSGSGSERWNAFGWCCDSYLGSESVTEAGGTARWNWQKRNGGKTVICLTSVAHKVLSQVDGWRADAWRREGAGMHLNRAAHGWDSSPIRASHRKPVSHIPPHPCLLTNNCLVCLQKKKNPLQIETLADSRKQGLRWHGRVFVYLQALCFYCCCNQHSRALYWKLISGYTCILK